MQGKGRKKGVGLGASRSNEPPRITSVVTFTPYNALPGMMTHIIWYFYYMLTQHVIHPFLFDEQSNFTKS